MVSSTLRKRHEDRWTLSRVILNRKIFKFDPNFQREEVWTRDLQRHLIDSILKDFDIPKIYVHELDDGTYSVVDGQQRLKAIWEFYDNNFPLSERYSGDLGGKTYKMLPPGERTKFESYDLTLITLRGYSDDDIRDVYSRLNKGKPLSPAEKLNAFPGDIVPTMRYVSKHPFFTDVITLPSKRYRHYLTAARLILLESEGIIDVAPWRLYDFFEENKRMNQTSPTVRRVVRVCDYLKKSFDSAMMELRKESLLLTIYYLTSHLLKEYVMVNKESQLRDFYIDFYKKVQESSETGDKELIDFNLAASRGTTSKTNVKLRHDIMLRRFLLHSRDLVPKDGKRGFTWDERIAVFRRENGVCQKCGRELKMDNFHVHHKVPHKMGGKTTLENAVLLCPDCHHREEVHYA